MNIFWEKFFYIFTFISQGSSFLSPRAYAVVHRMHHDYNDDHHAYLPFFIRNVWALLIKTKNIYMDYLNFGLDAEIAFGQKYPKWQIIDRISDLWITRFAFVGLYIAFYIHFAAYWWMFLLLPIHFFMGPIHGAMITWYRHQYGHCNYGNHNHNKSMLQPDLLIADVSSQNIKPNEVNFAKRQFDFDPTYLIIKILHTLHIVRFAEA